MIITFVQKPEDIGQCQTAILVLRPHLSASDYLPRMNQVLATGAQLLRLTDNDQVRAVAVIRVSYYLHRGKNLYIDDLVSLPEDRGKGYASALLDWIRQYAQSEGCQTIDLDSGYGRTDAHRLYLKSGFVLSAHHFTLHLQDEKANH